MKYIIKVNQEFEVTANSYEEAKSLLPRYIGSPNPSWWMTGEIIEHKEESNA